MQRWLIFDFGGGTLDVALIQIGNNTIEIIAIDGDNHLGGQDIDHALMKLLIEDYIKEFKKENNDSEPKITPRILARFKQAACRLKEELTGSEEADFIVDVPDFYLPDFPRAKLEEICKSVLERIMLPVIRVLAKSNMAKQDVERVVLAGGSSKMPTVRKIIAEFFNNRQVIDCEANP